MAGQQIKVVITVKKAARVVYGNSSNQLIRRRNGQTLPSQSVRHPIGRSPDRFRNRTLLERFQVFAEFAILALRARAADKLQDDHFARGRAPLTEQRVDVLSDKRIACRPQRVDPS